MTEVEQTRPLIVSSPASGWDRWILRLERQVYRTSWPIRLGRALRVPVAPEVRHHAVQLRGVPQLSRRLRIAFASDFHSGPTTDPALLVAACAALRAAEPDLLLLGGDFVEVDGRGMETLAELLGRIPAPLGRYAVLGNHDWWSCPQQVVDALESAGIEVLINRNVRLPAPFDTLWVCGLDDHSSGAPDAEAALEGAEGLKLVLMHSPSNLLDLGSRRFDLALCGHTHGGQIALPGGRPLLVAHGPLSRKYSRGRYELEGGGTLIVSVGLGCSLLPLRAYADPDIVVCDLIPADGTP